jgi:hypothetical protein
LNWKKVVRKSNGRNPQYLFWRVYTDSGENKQMGALPDLNCDNLSFFPNGSNFLEEGKKRTVEDGKITTRNSKTNF